jgi:hypothetical protein
VDCMTADWQTQSGKRVRFSEGVHCGRSLSQPTKIDKLGKSAGKNVRRERPSDSGLWAFSKLCNNRASEPQPTASACHYRRAMNRGLGSGGSEPLRWLVGAFGVSLADAFGGSKGGLEGGEPEPGGCLVDAAGVVIGSSEAAARVPWGCLVDALRVVKGCPEAPIDHPRGW